MLFASLDARSITGGDWSYLNSCHKAAFNDHDFQTFRSRPDYAHALELRGGERFAKYILENCGHMSALFPLFEKIDAIGAPPLIHFEGLGSFSGTTLRYIAFAHHIETLFDLPQFPHIVEIGAGFGGQCAVLSHLTPFITYSIYDLNQPLFLMERVHQTLGIPNVEYLQVHEELPTQHIDLFISNYAFSECDRATQLDYFHRVIKHCNRGYVVYNQIIREYYGVDCLSPEEFMSLLRDHGLTPQLREELICTYPSNVLITWTCTD